jgi:hypothetical protein
VLSLPQFELLYEHLCWPKLWLMGIVVGQWGSHPDSTAWPRAVSGPNAWLSAPMPACHVTTQKGCKLHFLKNSLFVTLAASIA